MDGLEKKFYEATRASNETTSSDSSASSSSSVKSTTPRGGGGANYYQPRGRGRGRGGRGFILVEVIRVSLNNKRTLKQTTNHQATHPIIRKTRESLHWGAKRRLSKHF